MPRIPVVLSGNTYESRSRSVANQYTQNWYQEITPSAGEAPQISLLPTPGMKAFGSVFPGGDRGCFEHRGQAYKVTGTTLYRVDTAGAHVAVGNIPGTARCIITGINDNIVITTQGQAYESDGQTVSTITDTDLESPNSCTHINNQIVYDGDGGRFVTSDVGDATSVNGLNYATAEVNADNIMRGYAHSQLLYLMGNKTIETWWNSGRGSPPFDRIEQGVMQIGLGALHSVSHNDQFVYLLGDDDHVYQIAGHQYKRVSTLDTHRQLAALSSTADASGFCYEMDNQHFYVLNVPGANKTFQFSQEGGWSNLSSGTSGDRSYANSYMYVYRKHLVADYRNGNIYEWDLETYTDAGTPIVRIRETGALSAETLGIPGRSIEMNAFQVFVDSGNALLEGQGVDPLISFQVSDDGGKSWSPERWERLGRSGQFQEWVSWYACGAFSDTRQIRLLMSDPVFTALRSAMVDVEAGV